jgi:TPR repeat protein
MMKKVASFFTGIRTCFSPVQQNASCYRIEAEQGNVKAQNNLGVCYANGWGINKNLSEAVKWYRKSAEQGCVKAQYNLANCYFCGEGVPEDKTIAQHWYKKAMERKEDFSDTQIALANSRIESLEKAGKEST